jgi:serine/threonine protein kinase
MTEPTFIHRYQVIERIGRGGMGSLYLARDPLLDRLVAVKVLREEIDSEDVRERFAREGRAAARLSHVNIVTVYDVGEHEGRPFIAMEYVQGQTLHDLIRRKTFFDLPQKLEFIQELCAGLAVAHEAGIVHRDVKPANLMITPQWVLKILDFGIARVSNSSLTQSRALVGTLNYMAPEQMTGEKVDGR